MPLPSASVETLRTFGAVWSRNAPPRSIGGAGPTEGDGSIASGIFANGTLYYAGGHSVINGKGSGGSIGAYDPGTGATAAMRSDVSMFV